MICKVYTHFYACVVFCNRKWLYILDLCIYSHWPEPDDCLQIQTSSLEIEEGGTPGFVEVTIAAPSNLMCLTDDPTCIVTISAIIPPSEDDVICPSLGESLPQVAVVPGQVEEECGVMFDAVLWPQGVRLPLAAVVDSFVDGDAVREVQVAVTVSWNGSVEYSTLVGTSQVNIPVWWCLHFFCLFLCLLGN